MANRVTLEVDTGAIIWDTNVQQGVEIAPDLEERKAAILEAMGYHKSDFSEVIVTLDYETGEVTWGVNDQQRVDIVADLAEREDAILEAMGYHKSDFSGVVNLFNAFANGMLDQATLLALLDAECEEEV